MRAFRGRLIAGVLAIALLSGISVTASPAPSASAASGTAGWLHTSKSSIKTANNTTYVIKAVSWFGMETTTCAPHGLWTISMDAGLAQIKSMGFNTVRLAFSNECLAGRSINSINYDLNPSLVGKPPLEVMDAFIARSKAYGLNVILDRHRPDSSSQSPLWYTAKWTEARWIGDWKALAKRYKNNSTVIGFDLHNEPAGNACWGCGNKKLDWRAAAIRAGNAVHTVNPRLLIIVEGVEKQPNGVHTWWGGGLQGVAAKPVTLKIKNRVVYSPHDYPASIYNQKWFSAKNYPNNLASVWDKNWGYIAKKNIAPILLGEFGTKLETKSDAQWMSKIVSYLRSNKMSFAYWSFNPNSGDTGGLMKDDWTTRQTAKLAALKPLLGAPVAVPTPPAAVVPKPTTPAPTTPAPSTPAPTSPTTPGAPATGAGSVPRAISAKVSAQWLLQSTWQQGYVTEFELRGESGASNWGISWSDPGVTKILSSWGANCTVVVNHSVSCTGADWAMNLPAGQTARIGVQVESSGGAPATPAPAIAGW